MPIDKDELRRKTRPSSPSAEATCKVDDSQTTASSSQETIAPIDINAEARQGGEHAIARKVEILHDAQRRGRNLADEEAVTELASYVNQANKRQQQMKQFMQSYRQGLNGALNSIAVDLPQDDEDFFGSVPEFSLPLGATSFLKGSHPSR